MFDQNMQQSLNQSQTSNISGYIISLNLRIEAAGNDNQRGEPIIIRATDIDKNSSSAEDNEAPTLLEEHIHEKNEDSVAKLKEQLQLADLCYSKLEEMYQKCRLCWLEECYRTKILEEYAPSEIITYSPRQITWNAPSPTQNNEDNKIEYQDAVADIVQLSGKSFCQNIEHIQPTYE
ncbi:hypothetical protein DEU56DRAFT_752128 [Suillus clintonianus]|uniref:uncharacterized protein n=1 Tax=Suillus clintonianus TaxID=1904413 RepID=UPI001B8630BD|nr:uncharacterized protein DEU56DRAFT_752128 [Suillus clintonianus]KAG2152840.1 hypothetical protein DEU56DRAFT_752128 [Suillus clintonianus]